MLDNKLYDTGSYWTPEQTNGQKDKIKDENRKRSLGKEQGRETENV